MDEATTMFLDAILIGPIRILDREEEKTVWCLDRDKEEDKMKHLEDDENRTKMTEVQ